MPITLAIDTDEFLAAATPSANLLSDDDILAAFCSTPNVGSYRAYLVQVGRTLEAKVLERLKGTQS